MGNAANGIERKATAGLTVSPISNFMVRIEGARGWNEAEENSIDYFGRNTMAIKTIS